MKSIYVIIFDCILLLFCVSSRQDTLNTPSIDIKHTLSEDVSKIDQLIDEAMPEYLSFLNGDVTLVYKGNDLSISDIYRFDTINERNCNEFALFDIDKDGIPELHMHSVGPYKVLSYKNGELYVVYTAWSYTTVLNNGAFFTMRNDGAPPHIDYRYTLIGIDGNMIFDISFDKCDVNYDGIYNESDWYFFDGIKVSLEIWDMLTSRYLSIGNDQIHWQKYDKHELLQVAK